MARVLTLLLLSVAFSNVALPNHGEGSHAPVAIGVFGLFHPQELVVRVEGPEALVLAAGERQVILQRSSRLTTARIARDGDNMVVSAGADVFRAKNVSATGRANEAADFELSVSRRIRRRFHGTLRLDSDGSSLVPVVAMDLEVAVASVVAAESTEGTPIEALKAQAVAVRSYVVASGRRHKRFDFCDTTHCQFLREPPPAGSAAKRATEETQGMVLAYESKPFAAMYTRSCSGHTHTPSQLGQPGGSYPYFAVECSYCQSHPDRWSTRLPLHEIRQLHSGNENSRLQVVRRLGWESVPSNDFTINKTGDSAVLEGLGRGHGIGLCQRGSKAMAEDGRNFHYILSHYYPNTTVEHF